MVKQEPNSQIFAPASHSVGAHNMTQVAHIHALQQPAYPEVPAYSTVSSYTLAASCDSSVLTPDSLAGSPDYHHTSKLATHCPPPGTPQQIPSPPGSATMYSQQWHNGFEINGPPSQTNSPLPPNANIAHGYVEADTYMDDDRRGTPGPPPGTYFGHYGVSDSGSSAYYMMPPQPQQSHHLEDSTMSLEPHQDPHHTVRPLLNHSRTSMSTYQPSRLGSVESSSAATGDAGQSASDSPKRQVQTPKVRKKAAKRSSAAQSGRGRGAASGSNPEEHTNCLGDFGPPQLTEDCPPEVRCIFESRWEHRNKKGQDMWDSIQEDLYKKFKTRSKKEMLQMKYTRGRAKHIKWLPKDKEILQNAWEELERERYDILLEKFLEKGGSRNMCLSASDIEIKVVNDLKLEEALYVDVGADVVARRRRKVAHRKRSSTRGADTSQTAAGMSMAEEMMVTPQPGQMPTEDQVIDQVFARHHGFAWHEDSAMHMMHPQQHQQQRSLPHLGGR